MHPIRSVATKASFVVRRSGTLTPECRWWLHVFSCEPITVSSAAFSDGPSQVVVAVLLLPCSQRRRIPEARVYCHRSQRGCALTSRP